MNKTREQIGNVVRERWGIFERVYCVVCGRNLPWCVWDCTVCQKERQKVDESTNSL